MIEIINTTRNVSSFYNGITIKPGSNEVDEKKWNEIKSTLRLKIKSGELVVKNKESEKKESKKKK